jgi:hemolysin III
LREPFSSISHLIAAVLSVVALAVLIVAAHGRPWHLVSFAIYGTALITLFSVSAIYHGLPVSEDHQERLKRLDWIAIYLLIAGTYTPMCLVALHGGWGWSILAIEYALAITGTLSVLFWKKLPHGLRVGLYLVMGWLITIAAGPLTHAMPATAIAWLVAGGVVYTGGAVVYATDKPKLWPGIFGAHDLWHVLVIFGSVCHFVMVLGYISRIG